MKTAELPVLTLQGSPRDRGFCYGQHQQQRITQTVNAWLSNLGSFAGIGDKKATLNTDSYIKQFLTGTQYLNAIRLWAPELLEEIKGIAEGSGQLLDHILALQLMDEEWLYGLSQHLPRPTSKCTAFGLQSSPESISYAGQNMDVPAWVEGKQLLLRIAATDETPEALVFTMAGNIGLKGLNAAGIGITCNTLAQLKPATDGLPVAFIVRQVLSMATIDQAEKFLHAIKHASGQNYILSSANDIRCFECSAEAVVQLALEETSKTVFHTNHPLVSNSLGPQAPLCHSRQANSEARLNSISARLVSAPYSLEKIKSALAAQDDPDNPVSRVLAEKNQDASIGYTAASSIYEFADKPRLHLAAGPPSEVAYQVFEFTQ